MLDTFSSTGSKGQPQNIDDADLAWAEREDELRADDFGRNTPNGYASTADQWLYSKGKGAEGFTDANYEQWLQEKPGFLAHRKAERAADDAKMAEVRAINNERAARDNTKGWMPGDPLDEDDDYIDEDAVQLPPLRSFDFAASTIAKAAPPIIPGVLPIGLTFVHGLPDTFKSAWVHKLTLCVADEAAQFEGVDIRHGRVLYVSLDGNATVEEIEPRIRAIHDRLQLNVQPDRLVLTDHPLYLHDAPVGADRSSDSHPAGVRRFIDHYKPQGPFRVLVIDSLFSALPGGFSEAHVLDALKNLKMMLREKLAESIIVITHDIKKGDEMYGSIFQQGDASGRWHAESRDKKTVTLKMMRMKNAVKRDEPLTYIVEDAGAGPFLASADEHARSPRRLALPVPASGSIKRADVLALVPVEWTPLRVARKGVDHLLGDTAPAREKTWQRLRQTWESAGLIEQRGGNIRRV